MMEVIILTGKQCDNLRVWQFAHLLFMHIYIYICEHLNHTHLHYGIQQNWWAFLIYFIQTHSFENEYDGMW